MPADMRTTLVFCAGMLLSGQALAANTDTNSEDSPSGEKEERLFSGQAYQLGATPGDQSALLYSEHHRQRGSCEGGHWQPLSTRVTYQEPDGSERGSKEVDYSVSLLRPSFTLIDSAFDERIEVVNQADRRATISYTESGKKPVEFTVELSSDTVIDAGFDSWVVQNWEALTAGETVEFQFLAPTRGKTFGFEGARVNDSRPTAGETVIRIQPTGFLVSFFADPIFLAYDDRRRITDYMGLGNMRRDGGDNHPVHIRYDYPQARDCAGAQ